MDSRILKCFKYKAFYEFYGWIDNHKHDNVHAKEQHKKIASICIVTGSVYGCKWMFIPNKYGI